MFQVTGQLELQHGPTTEHSLVQGHMQNMQPLSHS